MLRKVLNLVSVVAVILMLGMMNMLTPSETGPLGVLVFFTLFYIVCFGLASFLSRSFLSLKDKMQGKKSVGKAKSPYYYASVLAFGPVMLLAMQSFGGVSWLELGLVLLLLVIGCFYISKRA